MSIADQFAADAGLKARPSIAPEAIDVPGGPMLAQSSATQAAVLADMQKNGAQNATFNGIPLDAASAPPRVAMQFAADAVPTSRPIPGGTYTPTGSTTENVLAGAGKAVADLGRGVKQLADIPAQWLESKFPGVSRWAEAQGLPSAQGSAAATNADVTESRRLDAPLMNTGGGITGNIAGNVAMTLIPAAGAAKLGVPGAAALVNPTSYGAAAAAGALQGAVQPTIEGESKIRNAAVGAGAGVISNAAVNAIGRIAQPVARTLSTAHDKAVQVLQDAGVPLDAAQQSGSTFLNKLRSSFWDNPFTAGTEAELQGTQQRAFNKAVLGTVGEDATAATPGVMAGASKRINGVFKDTLDRTNVSVDSPQFMSRLDAIQQGANAVEKKPVSNFVNRIIGAADENGQVPGQVAYSLKQELDKISNTQDTTLNYWARQLNTALKDQMAESMTPADAAAFNEARTQFAKLKTIEPAIDRVGGGNISPAKLANSFATKANRSFSIYGRGDSDLVDLAQAGNLLLGDRAPNSGTTGRAVMQLGVGALGGGAYDAYQGDYGAAVKGAALGAAGMYAIPRVAQTIMNSPATANYLAGGMQTPLRNVLLAPQTNQAVGGVIRRGGTGLLLNRNRLSDLSQQNPP